VKNPKAAGSTEMTVGQVAARSGVTISAIHFYEKKGLLTCRRTEGRRRRYTPDVLQRVVVIKAAQSVGAPLSAVRELLSSLPYGRSPTAADWGALLARWRTDLEQAIANLGRLRGELDNCDRCGCLSFETCPLVAPTGRVQR
jgi:MerR family redox-sensitive transcriptional activator SoxR